MANSVNGGAAPAQRMPMQTSAQRPDWSREINSAPPSQGWTPWMPPQDFDALGATPWLPAGEIPGIPPAQPSATASPAVPGRELRMDSGLPPEAVEAPLNGEEVYQGSLKGLLARNLGHYVVATFLIGTTSPVSWEGFLHSVGNDYMVIFQPDQGRYITGDFYSLKFVEFHDTAGVVPSCPGYRRRDGQHIW